MEVNLEIKKRRNGAFISSLAEVRIKLAIANGLFILAALGIGGERTDYIIAGVYLAFNLLCLFIPLLGHWATRWLKIPLIIFDLLITGYMIGKTGGVNSILVPFLFIPVLAAIIRFRYAGVFIWSTLSVLLLVGVTIFHSGLAKAPLLNLVIQSGYLYIFGILGSFLISRTYMVTEEVSRKLTRWNYNLQRLNHYSLEVTSSSDLDDIFAQTIKTVLQSNPALMVVITMFEGDELKMHDSSGWEEQWQENYKKNPLRRDSLTLAPIQVFKEPLVCPDIRKHPELVKTFQGTSVKALFAFPIVVDREVAGALMIADNQQRAMSESEIGIMISVANQCGNALQHIAGMRDVRFQADTDGLTGLRNRRFFNEKIERLAAEAIQNALPLSLILMDVDNFKKYNDTYGHPAGDLLLKVVSTAISEAVRDQDIVARYGGEEFVVILRNTGNPLAMQIGERIRFSVENLPKGQLKCGITISVGVATMPEHAQDRVALIEYADKSLYQAKHSGKNRVCCGFERLEVI